MKRSGERILTTHVGSLPAPPELDWGADIRAVPGDDLRAGLRDVVARQREVGLDVINEGEYTKGHGWNTYVIERLDGFERRPLTGPTPMQQSRDWTKFADFYSDAAARGTLIYGEASVLTDERPHWVCNKPVSYIGHEVLAKGLEAFKAVIGDAPTDDCFITAVAPTSIEADRDNENYATQEEFVYALAEALRSEYEAIAAAGFLLQVDDAWLPMWWDRIGIDMGMDEYKRFCQVRVDALNHALSNIPEEQIRYHLCWGSWHGPHAYDIEMRHIVDLMLSVKARAYSFEAANPRHEHEYHVWADTRLPDGKILIPGVISHSTNILEHPELVSERIQRFARLVGRENVIAGADCGFGHRTHPQIAWAKLRVLKQGADLASAALW